MSSIPTPADLYKTFGTVYAVGAVLSVLTPGQLSKSGRLHDGLAKIRASNRRNVRLALVPSILPLVYRIIKRTLLRKEFGVDFGLNNLPIQYTSALSSILSTPVFLLLPKKLRVNLAVYTLWSFLYSFARLRSPNAEVHNEEGQPRNLRSFMRNLIARWREFLPPVWTLIIASNTWLLWAFLYHHDAFPQGYSKIITDRSRHYIPAQIPLQDFLARIGSTSHPRVSSKSGHNFLTCSTLHPTEASCSKNFLRAWLHETARTAPWVTSFTTLAMVLKRRKSILSSRPTEFLSELLESTARGTVYITGSITTAWGMTCLLQRLLPVGVMPHTRWLLNGSLPNLWILLLGKGRQATISLYTARLATLTLWKVWVSRGGHTLRFGELLILAMSWAGLNYIRTQEGARSVGGIVEHALSFVEGKSSPKHQTKESADDKV